MDRNTLAAWDVERGLEGENWWWVLCVAHHAESAEDMWFRWRVCHSPGQYPLVSFVFFLTQCQESTE